MASPQNNDPEKVPLFSSWNHWHLLVVALLVVQIGLYYWITLSLA
jgi:hypothetical protein